MPQYKTIRVIKKERDRMTAWRKFMKVFKFFNPHPVKSTVMNKIMNWEAKP